MATLKPETFSTEYSEDRDLLKNVRSALFNLTGIPRTGGASDDERVDFTSITGKGVLSRLNVARDVLRPDYRRYWEYTTVVYDTEQHGAEINIEDRKIILGPFLIGMGVEDAEKVIIHEFLHAALDDDWQRSTEQEQHGQINHIIIYGPHYSEPANPADPSSP